MAIDSKQKRMSAIHPASPWRGPLVDATESGFTQGNRQAADFMYSGIASASPIIPPPCPYYPGAQAPAAAYRGSAQEPVAAYAPATVAPAAPYRPGRVPECN